MGATQVKLGNALLNSLNTLREQKGSVKIEDVGAMLEDLAATLHPDDTDIKVRQEIQELASYIMEAKREISALTPEESSAKNIGNATSQLDAVVKSTEEATHTILDAVDVIQNAATGIGGDKEKTISESIAKIYEACNFQDLTGQRIGKVIATLEYIQDKVLKLTALFGAETGGIAAPNSNGKINRYDDQLLNGPQLPNSAPSQEDIDALFSSIKK